MGLGDHVVGCGGALGLGLAPGLGLGPLGVSLEAGPAKAERRRRPVAGWGPVLGEASLEAGPAKAERRWHPVAAWGAWRRAAALRVCVGALPGQ